MNRRRHWISSALITLTAAWIALACTSEAEPTATPARPEVTVSEVRRAGVFVDVPTAAERDALAERLTTAGQSVAPSAAESVAALRTVEASAEGAVVLASWSAIAHQRQDVFEVSVDDIRAALLGEVSDWSALGGSERPITVVVPDDARGDIAAALGVEPEALAGEALPVEQVLETVASTSGALGLVPAESLRPGVLAIVVDGHDPYRDPAADSPLRLSRTIEGDAAAVEAARSALGWSGEAVDFDPVGFLATGELIPVRCTNAALERVGRIDAMFDGTREHLQAADLTVMALEVPLTDLSAPSPCVPTFNLNGSPEVVTAAAEAGVDVMPAVGNHMKDCYDGCSGAAAMLDTLERLRDAGITPFGSGEDLDAAREPAVVEVGGVTFAFLGFDDIASGFYAAAEGIPGTSPLDFATLAADVEAATALADHVVVAFSWGIEYQADPTERQQEAAAIALQAGATLVVGNHPHWVQALDSREDTLIAYALGNFVFDQDWSTETQQGAVLDVGFTPERILGWRLRPVFIYDEHRPEFLDPAGDGAPILERTWEASDRLPR